MFWNLHIPQIYFKKYIFTFEMKSSWLVILHSIMLERSTCRWVKLNMIKHGWEAIWELSQGVSCVCHCPGFACSEECFFPMAQGRAIELSCKRSCMFNNVFIKRVLLDSLIKFGCLIPKFAICHHESSWFFTNLRYHEVSCRFSNWFVKNSLTWSSSIKSLVPELCSESVTRFHDIEVFFMTKINRVPGLDFVLWVLNLSLVVQCLIVVRHYFCDYLKVNHTLSWCVVLGVFFLLTIYFSLKC